MKAKKEREDKHTLALLTNANYNGRTEEGLWYLLSLGQLQSLIGMPLGARMYSGVFSTFVLSCVGTDLATADPPSNESHETSTNNIRNPKNEFLSLFQSRIEPWTALICRAVQDEQA
jgi:hypothetical protein